MGKGYQTTAPQFLDFVYQPNFNVAMQLADAEVKQHYNKSKLLSHTPDIEVEAWNEAHGDMVNQKRQVYEDQIQELSKRMANSKDPEEISKLMPELNNIKRQLKQDYTQGVFYTAQESAKNHKKFLEDLEKIQDPAAREIYKQQYEGNYLGEEADRSKVFTPGAMMETRNFGEGFLNSAFFRSLPPEKQSILRDARSKEGIITREGFDQVRLRDETIQKAYQQYIENEPGVKEYAKHRQEIFGEKFLNDKGEIDWSEEGFLGKQKETMGNAYSYNYILNKQKNYLEDPFVAQRNANGRGSVGLNMYADLGPDFIKNETLEGQKLTEEKDLALQEVAMSTINTDSETKLKFHWASDTEKKQLIEDTLELIKNSTNSAAYTTYTNIQNNYESKIRGGYEALAKRLNDKQYAKVKEFLDSDIPATTLANEMGYVKLPNGKSFMGNKKVHRLEDLRGEEYITDIPAYKGMVIVDFQYVPKSASALSFDSFRSNELTGLAGLYRPILVQESVDGKNSLETVYDSKEKKEANYVYPLETYTFVAPTAKIPLNIKDTN